MPQVVSKMEKLTPTASEESELNERIAIIEDSIIQAREIEILTVRWERLLFHRARELAGTLNRSFILLDLSETKPPNSEVRAVVREECRNFTNLSHIAVYMKKNFLIRTAARFIMGPAMGRGRYSFHQDYDAAMNELRRLRSER